MKNKIIVVYAILVLLFLAFPITIFAVTANTFRVTTDGSQQKDAFVYKEIIAYDSLSDIWGYDLTTNENYPIIQRDGRQYITDFFKNLIVYTDIPPDSSDEDVRLYNIKTGDDTLIIGEPNSYSNGGTNGVFVIYLKGGACGDLYAYNILSNLTQHIIDNVCTPKISDNIVYWGVGALGGSDIRGYDLGGNQFIDIAVEDGFQESADIYGDNVVWYQYDSGNYGTYQAIVLKNLKTGVRKVIYETSTNSLQYPSISNGYVVWSESPSTHVNSINAADLRTGEVFAVQEPGPHQNSHTMTSIWNDTAAWMSWRTGNGDIYTSILENNFSIPKPTKPPKFSKPPKPVMPVIPKPIISAIPRFSF